MEPALEATGLCGSDLHLVDVLMPYMHEGDVLGHEPMGVVEEVESAATNLVPGDRVVIPFQIACGSCFMCERDLQTQCETTQVTAQGSGAALYGYSEMYGSVPGAQAELLRVPLATYNPIKVPDGPPDDRFVYLSDVLPTAWQSVAYADVPDGGSVCVLGLGPIGQMATRILQHQGVERVLAVDLVPDRIARARAHDVEVLVLGEHDDVVAAVRDLTEGRGPDAAGEKVMEVGGIDKLAALATGIEMVRRGGTLSLIGVYGGTADPVNMQMLFDKQVQLRMGQANVKRWVDDILPLPSDDDPLGVDDFATHHVGLEDAPQAYESFRTKSDGAFKVVFQP